MKRALSGLRALLVQRVSAIYMLVFIVFLLAHFLFNPPASYVAWRAWIMGPVVGIAIPVFFAALLAHAWVGVRDVILDYIRPAALRFAALALLGLGLMGIGAWVIRILWPGRG
ncbi:MAG: succinate dehydrogenase, hydrophobic membrane anchor protein [Betaproteobacteria bacterium]